MSSAKEDALSPDELRKRLYQTFKSKGVLDTLKTQLRNQLIQELKHPPLTGGGSFPRPVPMKSESLLLSACNSIVADYLRSSGYEYSLSVFHPESGLCKDKVSMNDLLQLLKIQKMMIKVCLPFSTFSQTVSYASTVFDIFSLYLTGFLFSLLTQLTHSGYTQVFCHDADTQTTHMPSSGESLVEKMKMIDKEYESSKYSGEKGFSFQSKIDSYRKEIEGQMEAEMKTKIQHFKDVEIAKVKMEEKTKFHKEFNKLKQELEETYEMKSKALMEREKNAIARLQKQQEIEEKNIYMQRQAVLKEIETLRNRESELRLRTEAFEKTCQIHEEKVKTTGELLRRRELAVKTLEDTYDQRLKNELSRYQFELKEEFVKRTEKLTENETRNKVETARIQKEAAVLDAKVEEHSRACSELRRLQVELDTAHQQVSLLSEQKEVFRERLENMSDYSSLKREKTELQGQLRLLKKQLEEAHEENRLLRADLGRPSKEQLALQLELQRLQNARRLDVEEFDNQKQVLQAQLQSEVERCAQLQAQVIEYEEKSQWMSNHVDDIKMQLRQTQQGIPCLTFESFLISEARIQELQREAETLEEAYRTYQQRAVISTISHMLLPRPLSPQLAHPSHHPDPPLRKQHRFHPSQTTRTPSRKALHPEIPNQPKVAFLEYPAQPKSSQFSTDHGLHSLTEPLFARDGHLEDEAPAPSRQTFAHMSNQESKCQRVCNLLNALVTPKEISKIVGVSIKTVHNVKKRMTMSKTITRKSGRYY
uniref:Uncharacterized protein n=1 Tax=Sphaeramia orbicularis TaxID=375764 RepID=A0A673ASE6_9TELE